jgi:hypothetical protein
MGTQMERGSSTDKAPPPVHNAIYRCANGAPAGDSGVLCVSRQTFANYIKDAGAAAKSWCWTGARARTRAQTVQSPVMS